MICDPREPVRWIMSLDARGSATDKALETLGIADLEVGWAIPHGPPARMLRAAAARGALPEDGSPGLALLCVRHPLADIDWDEVSDALPPRWRLWVFTDHYQPLSHPNVGVQGIPDGDDQAFDAKVAGHLSRIVRSQPPGSHVNPEDRAFPEEHLTVGPTEVPLLPIGRYGLRVDRDGVPYDFFVDLRPDSTHLVILGQSALVRTQVASLPVFHRWKWLDDPKLSVIAVNDPTLYLADDLDGGWWVGTPDRDFIDEACELIAELAALVNLENRDLIFYGGSLGGFSSLQMAACLPGSRALVDNPQVAIINYSHRGAIDAAVRAGLGVSSIKEVPPQLQYRVDVVARFERERHVPEVTYLQNAFDTTHVRHHFGDFVERVSALAMTHAWARTPWEARVYSAFSLNRGGHFPLGRRETVRELHALIELGKPRPSSFREAEHKHNNH